MRLETNLTGEYDFYTSVDPAWRRERTDGESEADEVKRFARLWDKALASGDYTQIPKRDGVEPVRWRLKHIGSRHRRAIQDEIDVFNRNQPADARGVPYSAFYKAARMGLVGVHGIYLSDEEQMRIDVARDPQLETMCVTHECMDRISLLVDDAGHSIGEDVINEIGLKVILGGVPSKKL